MNDSVSEPNEVLIEKGAVLFEKEVEDALSVLGIQAEALEINIGRSDRKLAVPEWSDAEAFDRVLIPQRASLADLAAYARRGSDFLQDLLDKIGAQLRALLCKDNAVHADILALEGDAKGLLKHVAGSLVGVLALNLPAAAMGAAAALATALAVVLIKRGLTAFCAAPTAA